MQSTRILVTIAFLLVAGTSYVLPSQTTLRTQEPISPLEPAPALDERKVQLGAELFVDPILSGKNQLSCSACHDLKTGGTARMRRTVGYSGRVHRYNAPTIFNVANNYRLGWRGNFTSLEKQNETVLLDPDLMASEWPSLLQKLLHSRYASRFQDAYHEEPSRTNVLDALVTYQKSLATPDSRFDRYLRGDVSILTPQEMQGYELFKALGCVSCHQGSNIGGNLFQVFGIFSRPQPNTDPGYDGDLGRYTITHADGDKGVFRVPSLRNVALTAPYFHDGRAATLPEAVDLMARSQLGEEIQKADIDAIVSFLNSLTGEYKGVPLTAEK
jgi:cytochrome c peroxidase